MMTLKKKGNRYYREDRFSFRSFPISKVKAEKLLAEGKTELTEFFIWEVREYMEQQQQVEETKPSNVLNITDRITKKREDEKLQEAINKFKNEYLPNLSKDDLQAILNSGESFGETIVKICWRIDLERKFK